MTIVYIYLNKNVRGKESSQKIFIRSFNLSCSWDDRYDVSAHAQSTLYCTKQNNVLNIDCTQLYDYLLPHPVLIIPKQWTSQNGEIFFSTLVSDGSAVEVIMYIVTDSTQCCVSYVGYASILRDECSDALLTH